MTLHFQVKISSTHIIWILFSTRKRGTNKELELNNTQEVDEKSSSSDCNNDFSVSESSSVPADSDVNSNIRSRNRDQINVFDTVHRWALNYVKYRSSKIQYEVEPVHVSIIGKEGCGKSNLLRKIYQQSLNI